MSWDLVGKIPPTDLAEARLQAHWAAQVVAAVGSSLVLPAADESHTSMRFRPDTGVFAGAMTPHRFFAALLPTQLKVLLNLPTGTMLKAFDMPGHTLDDAFDWLNASIAEITGKELEARIERPGYYLESHPLATGAAFPAPNSGKLSELMTWFSNASKVLEEVSREHDNASPVRCWPHHFDMATLIVLDPEESDPERARSINVGMSPGDVSYEEPYFYVNPSPSPQNAALPALAGAGDWHTAGWLGAVLTASDIVHVDDAALQGQAVRTHLSSAIEACRELLLGTRDCV